MLVDTSVPNIAFGATSMDVLRYIASLNPHILSFEFSRYKPVINVSEMKVEPDLKTLMTRHYPPKDTTKLNAFQVINNPDPNFGLDLADGEVINLHSRVITQSGAILHVPMMDLDSDTFTISDENLQRVVKYAKIIGREGVVLQTGRSYHYYGFHLMTTEEYWSEFIPQSMRGKVCDIRFISHKLEDQFITLRITAGGIRNTEPKVVAII